MVYSVLHWVLVLRLTMLKKKGELLKFTFTLYGTHIILSSCAVRLCVLLLEEALELVQFNKDKENDEADPAISR